MVVVALVLLKYYIIVVAVVVVVMVIVVVVTVIVILVVILILTYQCHAQHTTRCTITARFRYPHVCCASSFPFFVKSFSAAVHVCGAMLLQLFGGVGIGVSQARLKQLSADQNRNMIGSHMPPEEPLTWRTSEQVRSSFFAFLPILPFFFSPLRLLAYLLARWVF